jgi:hypothetical protein
MTAIALPPRPPVLAIAPTAGIVFVAFFMIGLAMPVLPLHAHDDLGTGAFVVGLVAGSQFAAALVSRLWAGRIADASGPKRAVVLGLLAGVIGGICSCFRWCSLRRSQGWHANRDRVCSVVFVHGAANATSDANRHEESPDHRRQACGGDVGDPSVRSTRDSTIAS